MRRHRWLSINVELLSGRGLVLEHPSGRVMIASPAHTLAELAEAIDVAFARWDHSHLHEFKLDDGQRYMLGGSEFEPEVIDSTDVTLASLGLDVGTSFEYVFDLGDGWRHRCEVQSADVDPAAGSARTSRSSAGAAIAEAGPAHRYAGRTSSARRSTSADADGPARARRGDGAEGSSSSEVAALCAEDVELSDPALLVAARGLAAVRRYLEAFGAPFPT